MQPILGGPRAFLDDAAVRESLSLARGAQVRCGLDVLDSTDEPTEEVQKFRAGEVSWDYRAADPLAGQSAQVTTVRRQGTFELVGTPTVSLLSRRFRPWTQWQLLDGTWARWYLGVLVVTNPGAVDDDGVLTTRTLRLADKSYLWDAATLTEPVTVPSTAIGTDWVKTDLGTRFGETRFAIAANAATVSGNDLLFEAGTSVSDMYARVLNAVGNDQLTVDEAGQPSSQTLASIAGKGNEIVYGAGLGKLHPAGSVEPLLPSLPNVLRFSGRQGPSLGNVEGNGIRTVKNQSTGPGSIHSRGFEVEQRVDVDAANQTALDAVAYAEAQRYFAGGGLRWTGKVGLDPRHSDRDVIGLSNSRLGLAAADSWLVTSWRYPMRPIQAEGDVLMDLTAELRVATS